MKRTNTGKTLKISRLSKTGISIILCALLTFGILFSDFSLLAGVENSSLGVVKAYAKEVGSKNQQVCDSCRKVVDNEAPSMADYSSYVAGTHSLDDRKDDLSYKTSGDSAGYSTAEVTYETVIPGAVYRGGNAKSGIQNGNIDFDNDYNDFARVLPYGNTYINKGWLSWSENNSGNFTIDIKDDRFVWIASPSFEGKVKDSEGLGVNTDIFRDGIGIQTYNASSNTYSDLSPTIAYLGPLKGYLGDDAEAYRKDSQSQPADGQVNIIEAPEGSYLYQVTYRNAATLKDGTKGNLVITVTRVEIETTASQDMALITLQQANDICLGANVSYAGGDYVNEQEIVALTKDDVATITAGNTAWSASNNKDKTTKTATGAIIDFDIKVTDAADNVVDGSISYAAKDMDLENYQDLWGRSLSGEDRYKFNEAMTIVDGSLSYAVTPYYDHANATSRAEGWIPVAPGTQDITSPLHITKEGSGDHANGVRFSGVGTVVMRDKTGSFKGSLFTGDGDVTQAWPNKIITAFGGRADNADILNKDYSGLDVNDYAKRLLYGRVKDGSGNNVPWGDITAEQIYDVLGAGSYGARRGDRSTYDTGFAVLMDASGFKIQWSGSMQNGGNLITTLFDTDIYTLIEQTHGTGGGIYFETYDIANDCKVNRAEGTVTMGKGTDATVTVVPEDGYRVNTINVGGSRLASSVTFEIVYDVNNEVEAIKYKDQKFPVTVGNTVTIGTDEGETKVYGDITFDVNTGGSIDVTLPNMQEARHIHADFTADYYFYKVWKSKDQDPTSLKLTATPYAYKFKEVTIDGTKYTISGNTFTGGGKSYTLENNALKIGEDPNITVYYLEGNDLVSYKLTDPEDPDTRTEDKRFTIRLEYEKNGNSVEFEVVKADADNLEETNVIATTDSDGYPVWKIRYPAAGYTTKGGKTWPALKIETEPSAHNINHVERNYWFVTEDAPGWALVEYDNSGAEAPGVIDRAKIRKEIYQVGSDGHLSAWALASVKDFDNSGEVIKHAASSNHAYMSVFSDHDQAITKHDDTWGGKIVNIPLVVVNAEKTWDDFSNSFKTRQDVWFHIDAKVDGAEIKDILPPQKLEAGEGGNVHKKTWGNKKDYGEDYLSEYGGYDNVKVVGTTVDIPKDVYYAQDKNNPNRFIPMVEDGYEEVGGVQIPKYKVDEGGTFYYVNELPGADSAGNKITYSIRETDAAGNELDKSDAGNYLIGYKSEASNVAKDDEQVTLDGVEVDSYTGKLKNTLETVDFEVTKIWKENGATGEGRTHASDEDLARDIAKLKENYTLKENGEIVTDTETLKLQPKTAAAYVPASGDTPASGTLETKTGTDGTEIVFTWHNIPKYVGDTDSEGKAIVREAVYSVVESQLDGYNTPQYSDDGKALNNGTITNEVTPPEGTPNETYGPKNTPQTTDAKNMFEVTTETALDGSKNKIETYELIDPVTGDPAGADGVKVEGGTYTIDENGIITFTPDTDFVGDPPAVTVRGTDSNGLSAETTYTPHVIDNEKTVTRTITYEYSNGDPVLDSEGNPKTVVHTTTFVGSVNPETGEVTWDGVKDPESGEVTPMADPSYVFPQVDSDDIEGYTYDKESINQKTVTPSDSDWEEKVIYSPLGVNVTPDETYGLPNKPQTGTVGFDMETETYTDGTPNEITVKLIDPATGEETDEKTVDAVDDEGNKVGTYTLNDDGTITFMPNDGYVGNPKPLEVTGTDRFGTKAKTTYTPHIVDPTTQGEASRTIHYRYITEDGEEVTGDTKQTLTLTRHASSVDPKTGEVLEWGPWEPETFPAVSNPDSKVDGRVWFTDDSVNELTVTEPGDVPDEYVIYEKIPYTVTYLDGDNGKSDGKGNQEGEDYGNDVTGGNTVTPNKGYKFTGTYTYVITDHDGNVIGEGSTDDPTSLEITGNIVFTPVYEKLPSYNINYDKNGGSGSMDDNNYVADDETMPYDENTFTRKGYHFTGFLAYLTDPETGEETPITDDNGNPIVFTGSEDMSKYFEGMPDGTSIRMEAQWEPNAYRLNYDANGGSGSMDSQDFLGSDTSAVSKENTFTREGYTFLGFKAVMPDGSTLKDADGNDMLFTSTEDFMAYFLEYGDGSEITLVAQWEPNPEPEPTSEEDPTTGETEKKESTTKTTSRNTSTTSAVKKQAVKTGDTANTVPWLILLAAAASTMVIAVKASRRRKSR